MPVSFAQRGHAPPYTETRARRRTGVPEDQSGDPPRSRGALACHLASPACQYRQAEQPRIRRPEYRVKRTPGCSSSGGSDQSRAVQPPETAPIKMVLHPGEVKKNLDVSQPEFRTRLRVPTLPRRGRSTRTDHPTNAPRRRRQHPRQSRTSGGRPPGPPAGRRGCPFRGFAAEPREKRKKIVFETTRRRKPSLNGPTFWSA